jgi:tight adherence protein B
MMPLIVAIAAFVSVAALVGGVAILLRGDAGSDAEQRLDVLTGVSSHAAKDSLAGSSVLASPLDAQSGFFEELLTRLGKLHLLFEQADTTLTFSKFSALSLGFAVGGGVAFALAGLHPALVPVMALSAGFIPLSWLIMRRRRRLKRFAAQLPDALELIARALRAGHSLAAGFNLVAGEMSNPIAKEFERVFEEQNLGIPMEEALEGITDRVPNLDLKFFVTAVILQRQTGGDLAEILDKIGHLIRERFKIWGQVQALTGEGRLSGVVLLALPPVLFLTVYRMNPDYVMVLFTDPLGKKMLIGGAIMQFLGAVVIRKIVNIKV